VCAYPQAQGKQISARLYVLDPATAMSGAPGERRAAFSLKDVQLVEDAQPHGLTLSVPIFYLPRIAHGH